MTIESQADMVGMHVVEPREKGGKNVLAATEIREGGKHSGVVAAEAAGLRKVVFSEKLHGNLL